MDPKVTTSFASNAHFFKYVLISILQVTWQLGNHKNIDTNMYVTLECVCVGGGRIYEGGVEAKANMNLFHTINLPRYNSIDEFILAVLGAEKTCS